MSFIVGPLGGGSGVDQHANLAAFPAAAPANANQLAIAQDTNTLYISSGSAWIAVGGSAEGDFQNGGNSFGVTATVGTNDANALNLRTNNADKISIGSGSSVAITGLPTNATTGSGNNFIINGVAGSGTGTTNSGGRLDINAGSASVGSNGNGGNLRLRAGTAAGTGTHGNIQFLRATDGVETVRYDGVLGTLLLPNGTVSGPALTFILDPDTGFYNPSSNSNQLQVATGGVLAARFDSNQQFEVAAGTAALPAYAFLSDQDTGMSAQTADTLVLSTAGTARITVKSGGIINLAGVPNYADDTAAGAAGLVAGDVYRTGSDLKIKL